jgi:hypothetical protein
MVFSRIIVSFIILALSPLFLFSQEMRFGKYNDFEFNFNEVSFDPEADAVVLQESCYNLFSGIVLGSKIHRRIKILKESGKEQADVTLRYFKGDDNIQDLFKIKAQTINLINGEIQIEKLSKGDFYEVDAGDGWKEIRFTFPGVQIGSIIDFSYEKTDKSIVSLEGWVFQNEIPTLKSIYDITFPSFLRYKNLTQGLKTITHNYQTKTKGNYRWELENLNAFKTEPYMAHYKDYLEKIDFQLDGYEFREMDGYGTDLNKYEQLFQSWQDLAEYFTNRTEFKSFLEPKKKQAEITDINSNELDTLQLANNIYKHVTSQYKFSGLSSIVPTKKLNETISSKNGSRAEINLSLIAHLRHYGILAYPLLISSKGKGRSNLVPFPFIDQFNHLIAVSLIGNKVYYLDATNSDIPFGFLPSDFLVYQGFLMIEENSGLMDIKIPHSSGYNVFSNLELGKNSIKRESTIKVMDFDYILNSGLFTEINESNDVFQTKLLPKSDNPEVIQTISIPENDKKENGLLINYTATKELDSGKNLYITPFQLLRWEPNPFVRASRVFPVDFNYIFTDRYATKIEIPEGYVLDDFPENASMTLPSGAVSFNFNVNVMKNTAIVNSIISVKNHIIDANEYPDLKYLMDIISSKFKEPMVFIKKSNNTEIDKSSE